MSTIVGQKCSTTTFQQRSRNQRQKAPPNVCTSTSHLLQVLLNLHGVPPMRHNDEVATVIDARPVHITLGTKTRRRWSWIHVYFEHRLLHFFLSRRCRLPRSVHRLDTAPTHLPSLSLIFIWHLHVCVWLGLRAEIRSFVRPHVHD